MLDEAGVTAVLARGLVATGDGDVLPVVGAGDGLADEGAMVFPPGAAAFLTAELAAFAQADFSPAMQAPDSFWVINLL